MFPLSSTAVDQAMSFYAVILFLGACTKPPRLSMVTEYMEMGSLYYLIHLSGQKKKLSWRRRLKMLRDICRWSFCLTAIDIFISALLSNKSTNISLSAFHLRSICSLFCSITISTGWWWHWWWTNFCLAAEFGILKGKYDYKYMACKYDFRLSSIFPLMEVNGIYNSSEVLSFIYLFVYFCKNLLPPCQR